MTRVRAKQSVLIYVIYRFADRKGTVREQAQESDYMLYFPCIYMYIYIYVYI